MNHEVDTTTMPQGGDPTQSYTINYDAWNRPVQVKAGATTVAKYQYDGSNRRNVKLTYTGGTLTETRHFYYSNNWQDLEERVGSSTSADLQYVWGIRYTDELICRDDATPQRLYALQDANFNLTAICDTSGAVQERYVFMPYGQRTIYNSTWSTIRTTSSYTWTIAHQGLLLDPETSLIYNRNRYLHPLLGRFCQRDPIGYADWANIYEYVQSSPCNMIDASGLQATQPTSQPCCCCCVENAGILNIKKIDTSSQFGHEFDLIMQLSYKTNKVAGDCNLSWVETTNIPYVPELGQKPDVPMDLAPLHPLTLARWDNRKKPCPGEDLVLIHDTPVIGKIPGRTLHRTLQIKITINSTPNCGCRLPSWSTTLTQELDEVNGGANWSNSSFK